MKKILMLAFIGALSLGLVACDDSASSDGAGYAVAASHSPSNYGNLYKAYVSKTSAYAEVTFSGFVGDTGSGGNALVLPIWYGCSSTSGSCNGHVYLCGLSHISQDSNNDPDVYVAAWYHNGSEDDSFGTSGGTDNVFSTTDTSQKTFGCELVQSGGNYFIKAYLNGVVKASYQVGSSTDRGDTNKTVLDPGIVGSAYDGRAGFGIVRQVTDDLKVHSFALFDKRPL